jgi:hypothetical protein
VPQHLLHVAEIGAVVEHVVRAGVSQRMRRLAIPRRGVLMPASRINSTIVRDRWLTVMGSHGFRSFRNNGAPGPAGDSARYSPIASRVSSDKGSHRS